jgi:predicted acetyltransferase
MTASLMIMCRTSCGRWSSPCYRFRHGHPALEHQGDHIGYHVVPSHRRRGHATRMLAQALVVCQQLGLGQVLGTYAVDKLGSRRVIEANDGVLDRIVEGEARYWLNFQARHLSQRRSACVPA